jgi:uncharacterized circularly permuted ATP-grasp superfamily protein/uncharacterized alpha-E superfamily protein
MTASFEALVADYGVPAGHFDELLAGPRTPRPHWAAFGDHAGDLGPAQLSRAQARVARQIHENGVTYNVYADAGRPERPWSLDVLPHLVAAADWARLTQGLRQRARLLEAMASDLYGPQGLLADGLVPPALLFNHPGFLRSCHGVRPPASVWLHVVAFDLARGPDGAWFVADTKCQAPSGAGYALENRITVSRLFPDAFRDLHVQLLAPFFRTLQQTLIESAPQAGGEAPRLVLLTPGPYNETYFEHAYLARYLGFPLVEGGDLTVRDDRVFLKTVAGLQPVHAILRRLDDHYCDPLELRPDSTLGVPGLVQAWRAGHVLVANAFGTSVLESPALRGCLPAICRRLLGEPLALASVPEAAPPLSHVPVWHEDHLESRAAMLRVFLVSDGHGDYRLMPGGLTRIASSGDRHVVSRRGGGSSKDTWVLSEAPIERFSLLPDRLRLDDIRRSDRLVSSRSGENLFWLGRYAERSENSVRLLRAVLARLHQGDAQVLGLSQPIIGTCRRHGLLRPDDAAARGGRLDAGESASPSHDLERTLIAGLLDVEARHSVAFNIEQTVRVAGVVRDRLSSDNWRALHQLSQMFVRRRARHSVPLRGLSEAIELLDEAIITLVAVGGLEMAHMTRDDGWRFLSLGRHLERLYYVATTVAEVAALPMPLPEEPALLEWLLDLSDSTITYRALYMRQAEWLAVAELLLFDRRNPRSAAFQLGKLGKHVRLLPAADLTDLIAAIDGASATHVFDPAQGDLFLRSDALPAFLLSCERLALRLSDTLTLRYFSHIAEQAHATSLR